MRKVLFAMLLALPFGVIGASNVSATPVSGAAIADAAQLQTLIEDTQWRSWRRCRVTRWHRRWSRVVRVRRCWHR
jgi:hypothetical protein